MSKAIVSYDTRIGTPFTTALIRLHRAINTTSHCLADSGCPPLTSVQVTHIVGVKTFDLRLPYLDSMCLQAKATGKSLHKSA